MSDALQVAIAECLSLHAQAMDRLGTDRPELDPRIESELRDKLVRQRGKVIASLDDQADLHRRHLESLNKGLRIILRRLTPPPAAKPPAPPLPVWDDEAKAWRMPPVAHSATTAKDRIAELAKHFDERGPDGPNELFRD